MVDIWVAGGSEIYALSEGPSARSQEDYLALGPMFVRDIDAAEYEMSFKFELVVGHEWNMHLGGLGGFRQAFPRLMICGLQGAFIEEPWEYRLDESGCALASQ